MSERDALFNEIMDVIKKQNAPVGLVKAVLDEVSGEISRTIGDMSDEMSQEKSGESCSYWDCGDIKSPWACDHLRAPGELGIYKPRKTPCALDKGRPCGMYTEKP